MSKYKGLSKTSIIILSVIFLLSGYGCVKKPSKEIIAHGIELCKIGKVDAGIAEFNKAIAINPNDCEAYFRRSVAYGAKGNHAQVMVDLNKTIECNPNFISAYQNRAAQYVMNKDYDKAWGDVHKVESLGGQVLPAFLEYLKKVSGSEK